MAQFHVGDLVFVKSIGSVTEIDSLVVIPIKYEGRSRLKLVGYETEFGEVSAEDMELVRGGSNRMTVEMHLSKRKGESSD